MPKRDALKAKGMKRKGNLYDQIISMQNLRAAAIIARKGKAHQPGVIEFLKDEEGNLVRLHIMLRDQTYKTSPYHTFPVFEPKERLISRLPFFPDRIVHHAIMLVLETIFVASFTADTYSCIKGRGIYGAFRAVKRALRDQAGTQYCLKMDVRKFYPSVDHKILKQLLRRKFKDERLLWLLDEIIDSSSGLPIGNYLSQYFANYYLTGLDHYIKEVIGVRDYFRYADDIVAFARDKPSLHQLRADIEEYLRVRLKLEIKKNYQVFPVWSRGLDFIGYVFRHTHIRLRKSIKVSFCKLVATKPNPASIASYYGWAKHANCKHLFKTLLANEKFQRHGDHRFLDKLYRRQNKAGPNPEPRNYRSRLQNRRFDSQTRDEVCQSADRSEWPDARLLHFGKKANGNDSASQKNGFAF